MYEPGSMCGLSSLSNVGINSSNNLNEKTCQQAEILRQAVGDVESN